METLAAAASALPAAPNPSYPQHHWVARGRIDLALCWQPRADGRRVWVSMCQLSGSGAPCERRAELGDDGETRVQWHFGPTDQPIAVTLSLRMSRDQRIQTLWANVPLDANGFYDGAVCHWPVQPEPPAPPPPDAPAADVIDSELSPGAGAGVVDLFPFLWMRPPTWREAGDAKLRYLRYGRSADLGANDLYTQLSQDNGQAPAANKRADATAFRRSSGLFISATSDLPAPIAGFAAACADLRALQGPISIETLTELAEVLLGQWPADFLAAHTVPLEQIWQSVFALALAGTSADGALAAGLVDSLRCFGYLAHLAQADPALENEATRRLVLAATPCLPDAVAACALVNPPAAAKWQLLGVGQLELARQQPQGYALGEVADVLNVMPRERQERHELHGQSTEHVSGRVQLHEQRDERRRQADAANELADTMKAAFHSEGLVNDLSDITPAYGNLNLTLSGTAAAGQGALDAQAAQAAKLVQSAGERAARLVSEQERQQRVEVWREWREHRASRCLDNRDGTRLVGVYRWVDRLVRVALQPQGARLVLAFDIAAPAQAWLTQLAAAGPVPLTAPQPLDVFKPVDGQGCRKIQPGNYQSLGAQYGLTDLPAPPPDTLRVSVQLQRAALADETLLQVPAGYEVAGGSATLMLADTRCSLVASVGGVALAGPPQQAPVPLSLAVPAVTSASVGGPSAAPPAPGASTSVGGLNVALPAPSTAWLATSVLNDDTAAALIGQTGPVALTVMSDAPVFGLSVTLVCRRSTVPAVDQGPVVDPLLQAWQMVVYDRLWRAWQAAAAAYDAELAQRVAAASEGCREAVQRQALQAACLAALTQGGATTDAAQLTGLLEWAGMSWHYEAWAGALHGPLPGAPAAAVNTLETASARLFKRFLQAAAARVLVPVRPEAQTALLFALQWQPQWPMPPVTWPDRRTGAPLDRSADVPVTDSLVPLLEEQRDSAPPAPRPPWTLRLPLPLIYLQDGDGLPRPPATDWPSPFQPIVPVPRVDDDIDTSNALPKETTP